MKTYVLSSSRNTINSPFKTYDIKSKKKDKTKMERNEFTCMNKVFKHHWAHSAHTALNHRQNKHVRHPTVKQLTHPPMSPSNPSLYESGVEEGRGGTDAYWTPLSSSSPPPTPSFLSILHSCSSPSISLATHEPATMIDPTFNSTVPCKSIYIHIYYPYQIHTDVSLHLPFADPLGLS